MSKLAFVFLLATIVATAYALDCYTCPKIVNCEDPNNAKPIKCDSDPNLHYKCLKKITKNKQTNTLNTTRSCVVAKSADDTTSFCSSAINYENVFCEGCNENLCNSATDINVNVNTFVAMVLSLVAGRIFVR